MKKHVRWFVLILVLVCAFLIQTNVPEGSAMPSDNNGWESRATQAIQNYAEWLLQAMDKDSDAEFSDADFASINGYIIGKNFVWKRDCYRHYFESGIEKITVLPVEIQSIRELDDHYEAEVIIPYHYCFNDTEQCSGSYIYRVFFIDNGKDIRCIDIDTTDDYDIMAIKEPMQLAQMQSQISEKEYVDDAFAERYACLTENEIADTVSDSGLPKDEETEPKGNRI